MGVGLAELGVRPAESGRVAHNFFLDAACLVDAFVLEVEDRIDPVLALQRPEAVFKSPAGEDCAVSCGRLSLQIKFRSPSSRHSVFELDVGSEIEPLSRAWNAHRARGFDLQVSRVLEMMIIGDEIRALLRSTAGHHDEERQPTNSNASLHKLFWFVSSPLSSFLSRCAPAFQSLQPS